VSDNENNAAEVVAPTVPTAIIPVPAPVAPVMNATPPEVILKAGTLAETQQMISETAPQATPSEARAD
jgi:hypothetical protein